MNIVRRELRANLKPLVIWSAVMALLVYAGMLKYSGFQAAGQSINQLMSQIPDTMKKILGFVEGDLTSISTFYAIFYLYFMLLAGIHSVMLGAVIISKEERDKTADFLFVKPLVRGRVITAKLIAALINVAAFNLVTLVSSVVFVAMYNPGPSITWEIVRLMLALFMFQLTFLAVGAGIGALARNTNRAVSISTWAVFASFLLSVAINLYAELDFLRYLTPFQYFNASDVMKNGQFGLPYVLISALLVVAGVATSYLAFQKRDLRC